MNRRHGDTTIANALPVAVIVWEYGRAVPEAAAKSRMRPLLRVSIIFACVCWATVAPADVTSGMVDAGFGELGGPWDAHGLDLDAPGLSVGMAPEDERARGR